MKLCQLSLRAIFGAGVLLSAAYVQAADQLIKNGGFEADRRTVQSPDSIAHWGTAEEGALGTVFVSSGGAALNGDALPMAASGQYYGLLDNIGNSRQQLSQSFIAPRLASAELSFDLFFANAAGGTISTIGLEYDWNVAGDNFHYRVDLLTGGADAFSTAPASVVKSLLISGGDSAGWQHYNFDLSDALAQGGSFQLRFASVSNLGQSQLGVDNISLQVTPVPEPASYALMLAGVAMVGVVARRRSRHLI